MATPILCLIVVATPAAAQTVPTIDTEDADFGSAEVGESRLHPMLTLDMRNGDFARGAYDDDAAGLDRLPVHVRFGLGYELARDDAGSPTAWLVLTSFNGFHAPAANERRSPRAWYESNNLVGLVVSLATSARAGLVYTIKTSPNGVSDTSREASATFAYEADTGLGVLNPGFAATVRPKGYGGLFTQLRVAPEFDLSSREHAPTLSIPAKLGVGWAGFYGPGMGDAIYGSIELAYEQGFGMNCVKWNLRAEALALVRDGTLRRQGGADASRDTVVPLVTIGVSLAY